MANGPKNPLGGADLFNLINFGGRLQSFLAQPLLKIVSTLFKKVDMIAVYVVHQTEPLLFKINFVQKAGG